MTVTTQSDARDGVVAALVAYLVWGFLPIYFKALESVPATEVLVHRIVWAVPFGALIIHLRGQWGEVRRALTHRSMLFWLSLSALFIAVNWLAYIWAVQSEQVFQASLGYYINPLIWVLVGVAFMGERLRRLQLVAVLLATVGVLVLTISGGQFPLLALFLAVSFTAYGVIRKKVVIGGMPGLFVETVVLLLPAIAWLAWLAGSGAASFGGDDTGMSLLLLAAGPITVVPLLCFALAARRLTLTTIGFMQFIAPTLQFACGVYFGEALTTAHMICFGFIWTAVIVFSVDAMLAERGRTAILARS